MPEKVAVLMGGMSSEREVSFRSGRAVSASLGELGYRVVEIDATGDLALRLAREEPDLAFIALHGRGGEDGTVQGLLEIMGIPYTGPGIMASAVAMDKALAKELLRYHGIPVCRDRVVCRGEDPVKAAREVEANLGFPLMVKPNSEGSSIGLTRVDSVDEIPPALEQVFRIDELAIVEQFIVGRMLTVGFIGPGPLVLPVLEVSTNEGFYDYRAKYEPGLSSYHVPAELDPKTTESVLKVSIDTFRALRCEDLARVDVMLDQATGTPVVLELNTVPGMTGTSLLPKAAAAMGISFTGMVDMILEGARLKVELGAGRRQEGCP